MSDFQKLELILRRLAAKRQKDREIRNVALNMDLQAFIEELANELAQADWPRGNNA